MCSILIKNDKIIKLSDTPNRDSNIISWSSDNKFSGILAAALAGEVDFDGPKRYRANTGGEKMKMAKL